MGRIKTKAIKRTGRGLFEKAPEIFSKNFEENKKALGNEMSSKKNRNMVAGYISRLKKQEKKIIQEE